MNARALKILAATKLLPLLLLLALPAVAQAQTYYYTNSYGIWDYTPNNGPVTITGVAALNHYDSALVIPNTINGYQVVSIAGYAFASLNINSVTIPDSVTSIGNYAFGSCGNLTSVTIGSGVTSIVSGAFQQCSRLTNITVNASPDYSSMGGVLFDKAQVTLLQFPGGLGGSYTIPASVTSIGEEAFLFSGLTSVTIPGSVTSIPQSAFENCANLTSITIPDSVTSIGSQAFGGCGLTSVTIGTNVTSIGDQAFFYCSSLTGVYFQGNSPTPTNDTSVFSGDNTGTVYYLPGTTGWGTMFDGWPTALWLPQVQTGNDSFGVKSNQFGFNINWAGNMVVVVEAATNLANPVWIPVGTNTLTGGTSSFSDPQWTNYPGRYYRLSSP